jgi:hypothetical protein
MSDAPPHYGYYHGSECFSRHILHISKSRGTTEIRISEKKLSNSLEIRRFPDFQSRLTVEDE